MCRGIRAMAKKRKQSVIMSFSAEPSPASSALQDTLLEYKEKLRVTINNKRDAVKRHEAVIKNIDTQISDLENDITIIEARIKNEA